MKLKKHFFSTRSHLIKGIKGILPTTEEDLASPKFSYMVYVPYEYRIMPNMKELKDQGRLVLINGEKKDK